MTSASLESPRSGPWSVIIRPSLGAFSRPSGSMLAAINCSESSFYPGDSPIELPSNQKGRPPCQDHRTHPRFFPKTAIPAGARPIIIGRTRDDFRDNQSLYGRGIEDFSRGFRSRSEGGNRKGRHCLPVLASDLFRQARRRHAEGSRYSAPGGSEPSTALSRLLSMRRGTSQR